MAYKSWICETCKAPQKSRTYIWDCPGCGKETCESCFGVYAHCKSCCKGKTDEELRVAANTAGWYFDPPEAEL